MPWAIYLRTVGPPIVCFNNFFNLIDQEVRKSEVFGELVFFSSRRSGFSQWGPLVFPSKLSALGLLLPLGRVLDRVPWTGLYGEPLKLLQEEGRVRPFLHILLGGAERGPGIPPAPLLPPLGDWVPPPILYLFKVVEGVR